MGSNDLRSRYLGAYGTWMGESGLYADVVLQAGSHRYTVEPLSSPSAAGKSSSALASLEVGQSFALGNSGWQIEPQFQLIRQHLDLDDAEISAGLVQQDTEDAWIARFGGASEG